MRPQKTTLVMAGAREAHGIITALLSRRRHVIASLPEPERLFGELPVETRIGTFETTRDLDAWLQEKSVTTVIDASHTFDAHISKLAGAVCTRRDLRYLRVLRPPWVATPMDQWSEVMSIRAAVRALPRAARVFSNTGWQTVPEYEAFAAQALFMRQNHEPSGAPPYGFVTVVQGNPPFSQFQEETLFKDLRITHLICRNTGGAASMSKLLAARTLKLPVMMVARSAPPAHHPVVESVVEALAWEANQ